MRKRRVNKHNKKNIYCAHCDHYDYLQELDITFCSLKGEDIKYWNRCKYFKWAKRYDNE